MPHVVDVLVSVMVSNAGQSRVYAGAACYKSRVLHGRRGAGVFEELRYVRFGRPCTHPPVLAFLEAGILGMVMPLIYRTLDAWSDCVSRWELADAIAAVAALHG